MSATLVARTRTFLEMIRVSHTVFALPFAVGSSFLAAGGLPDWGVLGKISLAVLAARTGAMTFNRIADRRLDAENPRTARRALPTGELSLTFAVVALAISIAVFLLAAWWLNDLCLRLAPIALFVMLGYSLTKRFTAFCHFVLGAALGLAPVGAWVAVRGTLDAAPWVLGSAVLLWTAGFDIIYACMDAEVDRRCGLRSVPARLGIARALRLAAHLHALMVGALAAFWWVAGLGPIFAVAVLVVAALLFYEHRLVRPDDLTRVQRAFFTMNGTISLILMAALIASSLVVHT